MRLSDFLVVLLLLAPTLAKGQSSNGPFAAIMTSPAAPVRRALIITPTLGSGSLNPRNALAASDAAAYRDVLRLLGFSGTIVVADTRLGLRDAVRAFAGTVPRDAEVALFVLGAVIPAGGKLYVPASDLPASDRTPERIATAAIDLAEILRAIAEHGPKDLVALIDECGTGEAKPSCDLASGTVPEGVSAIVVHRVPGGGDRGPVAGVATIRQDLLPLMREPGLTFLELYGRLKARLDGTNDGLVATPSLSRNFAFLPGDFLSRLPVECNRIDPAAEADSLRRAPSVAPLVPACERAATTYDFSPFFKDKLAAAREQLAFQKAVAGCTGDAAVAYLASYPSGAYRFAVAEYQSGCERAREPPPAPPAPPPVAADPEPVPNLQSQAYAAVMAYYQRHSYTSGDNLSGNLAALYPQVFTKREGNITRDQHLTELAQFYARYSNFNFQVLPGSLDYSGCDLAGSCLMRGTVQVAFRKLGDPGERSGLSRFSLRFDLRRGIKVLYECAVVQLRVIREAPCE